jgi:broad specificity phosphatase PhoE
MEKVIVLRHGKRDKVNGKLTPVGLQEANELGRRLPKIIKMNIAYAVASDTDRAKATAKLASGLEPHIDPRAGFLVQAEEQSEAIGRFAVEHGVDFMTGARQYDSGALAAGIADQAAQLDELITELLVSDPVEGAALIVTHGLTVASALPRRELPEQLPDYLSGYWVSRDGTAGLFTAQGLTAPTVS